MFQKSDSTNCNIYAPFIITKDWMNLFTFPSEVYNKVTYITTNNRHERLKLSEDSNSQVQNTEDFVGIFSVQEGISHMY